MEVVTIWAILNMHTTKETQTTENHDQSFITTTQLKWFGHGCPDSKRQSNLIDQD